MVSDRYYNMRFRATLDTLKSLQVGTERELKGADLMAYFGGKDYGDRTLGIGFIGSACWSWRNDSKVVHLYDVRKGSGRGILREKRE